MIQKSKSLEDEPASESSVLLLAATEREKNNVKSLEDFRLKNGSSPGQNLAVTFLCMPSSLDSGTWGDNAS